MFFEINSVNVSYDKNEINSVRVNFNGRSDNNTVFINGNLTLTEEEYRGNESLDVLADMTKDYVIEQINATPEEEQDGDL